jgi:hypothetical protein
MPAATPQELERALIIETAFKSIKKLKGKSEEEQIDGIIAVFETLNDFIREKTEINRILSYCLKENKLLISSLSYQLKTISDFEYDENAILKENEKLLPEVLSKSFENIRYELEAYRKKIPMKTKEAEGQAEAFSRFPWSSDQTKKLEIVDGLLKKLQHPTNPQAIVDITPQNMVEMLGYIRTAIKNNKEATRTRLFHYSRRLETILKRAEKQMIETVPNGYVINQLAHYIEKAKKEDVQVDKDRDEKYGLMRKVRGPFESDRNAKVKLAKDLLALYENNTPPDAMAINKYIEVNKGFTKGKYSQLPGFHRAGKLESILKHMLNEAKKQDQNRPKEVDI